MSVKNVVLIAGVHGVSGRAAAEHWTSLPGTRVYGLSRRSAPLWRSLTTGPVWKYQELPHFLLPELIKLDLVDYVLQPCNDVVWMVIVHSQAPQASTPKITIFDFILVLAP